MSSLFCWFPVLSSNFQFYTSTVLGFYHAIHPLLVALDLVVQNFSCFKEKQKFLLRSQINAVWLYFLGIISHKLLYVTIANFKLMSVKYASVIELNLCKTIIAVRIFFIIYKTKVCYFAMLVRDFDSNKVNMACCFPLCKYTLTLRPVLMINL